MDYLHEKRFFSKKEDASGFFISGFLIILKGFGFEFVLIIVYLM